PYYLVNEEARFEAEVVRPFVDEYLAGRTPIPCTLCNNHLKFDALLTTARQIGAERIATGHYARNRYDEARGRWILSRPEDKSKDQTYFLFGLTQERLSRWPTSPTRRRYASSPAATTRRLWRRISMSRARRCPTRRASW